MANGEEASGVFMGWGAGVTALAAGGGFGLGIAGLNPLTSAFLPSIGDGSAGYKASAAAPSAAPKGSGLNGQGGAGATGQIGQIGPPKRNGISTWPTPKQCQQDPYASGCMNPLSPLDFMGGGVIVEGGEVGGRMLFNLLRKLIPRALEGSIEITEKGLAHVLGRHIIGGAETAGKSIFSAGTNVEEIVKAAEAVKPVLQSNGNFQRIVDAGRVIGTTFKGEATHLYTVITDAKNTLITAFPGIP